MLLHQTILNRLPLENTEQRLNTDDALDTAASMILEAARDHSQHFMDVDALSLSCSYCLDVAVQRYEDRTNLQQQGHLARAAESARSLMKAFRERWPSP